MFVLDRIKMLKITGERFAMPGDFSLEEFMRDSFKVMHDDIYAVKIRISPGWSRWVGEKIWHESQKVTKLPSGRIGRDQALGLGLRSGGPGSGTETAGSDGAGGFEEHPWKVHRWTGLGRGFEGS
jgi:hypothetical protein